SIFSSDMQMVYQNKTSVLHKKKKKELDDLLYSNYVGNQGLIKRKRLLAVGSFNESLKAAQDYDLWIRLCETFGPVRNVRQPLQDIHMDHEGKRITEQSRSEEHTSELQSRFDLVCRLLLEKKNNINSRSCL